MAAAEFGTTKIQAMHLPALVKTPLFSASLSKYPTTPGQHVIVLETDNLFSLAPSDLEDVFTFIQRYTRVVQEFQRVQRCGLAYDGHRHIHIIPMHGLAQRWNPVRGEEIAMFDSYPGYLVTKSSPQSTDEALDTVQSQLTTASGWREADHTFLGDAEDSNLFARLTRGEIPQWRVWEDDAHLAFLSPFPNTPGFTVLIPRQHLSSNILGLSHEDYLALVRASFKVAKVLMSGLHTTRVGLFFEGFEIDYAHAKLLPITDDQADIEGPRDEYHQLYPGYITTRLGPEQDSVLLDQAHSEFQKYLHAEPFLVP